MPNDIKSQSAHNELVKSETEGISEQTYHDTREIPIKPPRRKKCEKRKKITVEILIDDTCCEICDNVRLYKTLITNA